MYISIGPLRRLIYYLFVDYPPMNINWAAPAIDIYWFVDYPPIVYILDYPPNRIISCTNSYGPRMFPCIWNACMLFPITSNHMQIRKHAHIHIKIKSHKHVM